MRAVRPRDMAQPQVAEEWDRMALHALPHGTSMSPLYNGPMHAWQCERCKRVWHMRPGVEPPPTGCGNAFAGCAGREALVQRVPGLDWPADEGAHNVELA